ncbi:dethiobiotin synthase [Caldimonas brevitalea]|uniref:ATP-dependent dethiobiotin synthetase BioD n=1 Tax=Caldimonas brevitalea TaxID=413882 RepID=A0A0G3BPI5_9BURK|nr:dethiobiotin synthase [Caldimonas brevitalea]AKJ31317.1 dethiobiotin synthetase [Caldimonas brevitalea]
MTKGCFVTGTDTEVGKTFVSAALLQALAASGLRCAGYKPVAAGTVWRDGRQVNEDVEALKAASNVDLADDEVCATLLHEPCAPHIAARLAGRVLSRQALLDGAHHLARRADVVVVEGVGGFCVPLGDAGGADELAADLGLPVVLVVGLRLGCLNHALLTAEVVRARGLPLAGWVGNRVDPGMAWADDNIAALHSSLGGRFDAPCLGIMPWLEGGAAAAAARHLDVTPLLRRWTP